MSINKVVLSGNLTRDCELRSTASGSTILVFGIAVNERIKRGEEWEDYPNFFECVMFGKRAESISKIMAKGVKVVLSGRLRYSSWENKDGQRRSKVEVIAEEVDLMQRRGNGEGTRGGYGQASGKYSGDHGNGPRNGSQDVPDDYMARDLQRMAIGNVNDASNYYDEDVPF